MAGVFLFLEFSAAIHTSMPDFGLVLSYVRSNNGNIAHHSNAFTKKKAWIIFVNSLAFQTHRKMDHPVKGLVLKRRGGDGYCSVSDSH